nr:hypothetical protein [Tanacetum cinerariifolium]
MQTETVIYSGVSTEDANQKFLRSLPSSWSQVSLIMRTKPGVDTLSFDDLYNNLRVFESDVKGSTTSSSCTQNVAFVSYDITNCTNEVSNAYGISTSSGYNSQKEGSSSYTDDLMYFFFANQSSGLQLDHEDLEQVDEFDLGKMDLKWQVAMISTRLKKFYKKTRRKLRFDAKEPVGFDKNNVECFNCHIQDTWLESADQKEIKKDEHKAMVTIDGECVDWIDHAEDDIENYALMAFNSSSSGLDTEREQLGIASIEIQAYTLALKKVEAQLICHQKNQLAYEEKVSRSSDVEDNPVNDRFVTAEGMHAVPPPMIGIYMPHKSNFRIDASKFTYGPRKFKTSESDAKTSDLASCESNYSVETLESMPKPIESKPKSVSEPRIWSVAPIIEEYESDSDDEYVFTALVEQEKPSFAFINTVKHVKTPRQTVKDQGTYNPHQTLKGKGIVDYGCSRHMTGNKAYLVEYQDFNGGLVAFRGSKGQITEFKNMDIIEFYASKGIKREYSNARTLQQNRVAERKNRTLIEATRTMLADSFLPNTFWVEAVSTTCYVLNRVLVTKPQNKTSYELITGPKETNNSAGTQDNIDAGNSKMEARQVQEYYVLPLWSSYTLTVKSLEAKNRDEKLIGDTVSKTNEEPVDREDQAFLEELARLKRQEKETDGAAETLRKAFAQGTEDLLIQAEASKTSSTNYVNTASTPVNNVSTPVNTASPSRDILSLKDIYEVPNDGIFTNASYDDEGAVADFTNLESTMNVSPIPQSKIHSIHPTTQILRDPNSIVQTRSKVNKSSGAHAFVSQALEDESWVDAMQEELLQEEEIDYDEVFAPVARIESIRIFLAFASYIRFIVYQIDVKRVFLYSKIDKEVYDSQLPGFIDPKFPKKVYKVIKALYGLHQALRAWYAILSTFLVQSGYREGLIDKTLFIKKDKKDIMLVKQREDEIFISQDKYVVEILKKFNFMSVKTASTPIETKKPLVKDAEAADVDVHLYRSMVTPKTLHLHAMKRIFRYLKGQPKLGLWYPRESAFDLEVYSDSDYDGANLDRKSTTRWSYTDKVKVINTEAEGVSVAGETLNAATLTVSIIVAMVVMVPAVGGGAWRRGGDVDGGCSRAAGWQSLVSNIGKVRRLISDEANELKWWRLSWCSNGGDEVGDDEGVAAEEIAAMVVMVPAVGGGVWRRGGDVDGGCGGAAGVVLMISVAAVDSNFNNENKLWEFNLDIDDSDIHLTPVVRSSSSTHVELSPYTSNPVTIIPGLAGIVQLSSSTRVEPSSSTTNPVRIIRGHAGIVQQANPLKERDILLGIITGTIHYKVLDVGSYGNDITVGAAMILANVYVFTPKPSQHYLNITMRNVIEVFRKDTWNIEYLRVLHHRSTTQVMRTTTKEADDVEEPTDTQEVNLDKNLSEVVEISLHAIFCKSQPTTIKVHGTLNSSE